MKTYKQFNEGLTHLISRHLGHSWGKIGDKVKGSAVHDYMRKNVFMDKERADHIKNSKFELQHVSLEDAKKHRKFTDEHDETSVIHPDKMNRTRKMNISHDSLLKHPPVLHHDGYIDDGNHRMQRAIELGMSHIPVLRQVK